MILLEDVWYTRDPSWDEGIWWRVDDLFGWKGTWLIPGHYEIRVMGRTELKPKGIDEV